MVETKYDPSHHAGGTPEARIASRLKNSGAGADPDQMTKEGSGARRTFHNIHEAGHPVDPSTAAKPTGDGRVADNPMAKSQQTGGAG
jgi:hypothetical protein